MADEKLPTNLQWIADRVCPLLKGAKVENFLKLYLTEEGETILKRFVSDETCITLFFGASLKDMSVWESAPPAQNKKKVRAYRTAAVHKSHAHRRMSPPRGDAQGGRRHRHWDP